MMHISRNIIKITDLGVKTSPSYSQNFHDMTLNSTKYKQHFGTHVLPKNKFCYITLIPTSLCKKWKEQKICNYPLSVHKFIILRHAVLKRNIFCRYKAYWAATDWHFKCSGKNYSKFLKKVFLCNKAPITAATMGEQFKDILSPLE
jgi:hypothetical protein